MKQISTIVAPPNDQSPEELALRARDGSLAAFADLVRLFEGRLINFLLRRVPTAQDAEDLAQEAFVRAWTHIADYDPRWRFSTWLFTIASRLAISQQRRAALVRPAHEALVNAQRGLEPEHAGDAMITREAFDLVWQIAEQKLSRDQISALWLRYAEDCSIGEIATILRKSQVGVRVMLFRARQTISAAVAEPRDASRTSQQLPAKVAKLFAVGPAEDEQLVGEPA